MLRQSTNWSWLGCPNGSAGSGHCDARNSLSSKDILPKRMPWTLCRFRLTERTLVQPYTTKLFANYSKMTPSQE
eukprot:scaffold464_cov244-Pinguiococcus_pyrenoidosus.AAC.6